MLQINRISAFIIHPCVTGLFNLAQTQGCLIHDSKTYSTARFDGINEQGFNNRKHKLDKAYGAYGHVRCINGDVICSLADWHGLSFPLDAMAEFHLLSSKLAVVSSRYFPSATEEPIPAVIPNFKRRLFILDLHTSIINIISLIFKKSTHLSFHQS